MNSAAGSLIQGDPEFGNKILKALLSEIPAGVAVNRAGPDYEYILWNAYLEKTFSIKAEDAVGRSADEIFPSKDSEPVKIRNQIVMREKKASVFSNCMLLDRIFEIIKAPILREDGTVEFILTIVVDVSEQIRMLEKLVKAEKMQVVGQLAGGIAHDFNNQLMSILGYSQLLMERLNHPELAHYAGSIIKSAEKSAELTAKLLAYSRRGKLSESDIDINSIIDEVLLLIKYKGNPAVDKIRIEKKLQASENVVRGDISLIQNALFILALNSIDAMPEGGELLITTENVYADPSLPHFAIHDAASGRYLKVTVKDTGCGISPEIAGHIFEPFFTTKKGGEGSGMGLAAVFGTVKSHNGTISVVTGPGEGTAISLYFPAAGETNNMNSPSAENGTGGISRVSAESEDISAKTHPASQIAPEEAVPDRYGRKYLKKEYSERMEKARKHIMVVDDESVVRDLTGEMLKRIGYDVTLFDNAITALSWFEENSPGVDLLILDMIMPHMGGKEAFYKFRKINPGLKVIVLSGFSIDNDTQELINDGIAAFIQKPVSLSVLKKKLEEIFNSQTKTASGEDLEIHVDDDSSRIAAVSRSGIDTINALGRLDGDISLYRKLVERFIDNYRDSPEMVFRKYDTGDYDWLHNFSHSLKSLAGNLGASELSETAAKAEAMIKSGGKDLSDVLTDFSREIGRIIKVFSEAGFGGESSGTVIAESTEGESCSECLEQLNRALRIQSPKKARELLFKLKSLNLSEDARKILESIEKHVEKYRFRDALEAVRSIELPDSNDAK